MLQIKNLSKVYRPRKGVPVTALSDVSLTFPDKGMVFLLGKSGSGKSTLLNLLGGLDSYDSGEIIISGTSSKDFRQRDFDSYRNTLVGFIFQEYNVLDDFTVGANIALALELQGQKATDAAISAILEEVDLAGYGARRPNELSGGQKQRVAIARALVKNPKIIMADEPTGALDSVTGRRLLDTLKKLSREKLVIVVSHDREFALQFADRIVELADGKVISDQEYFEEERAFQEQGICYGEGEITVCGGYTLTEEDRAQINAYLAALSEDQTLSIRPRKTGRVGRDTRKILPSAIREKLKLIPSRLPMKAAFKIGAGALKHKKIRLVFTIFLSCIAFGLFGLSDTFGAYDHITTCVRSILDTGISYASLAKVEKETYGDGEHDFYYTHGGNIKKEELEEVREKSGVAVHGVFVPYGDDLNFSDLYNEKAQFTQSDYHIYPYAFNGFAVVDEKTLADMDMTLLAGRLPQGDKKEIAITSYVCETFMIGGWARQTDQGKVAYDPIEKHEDMLGKVFPLNGEEYTVVGVVSSGFDLERYRSLTEEKKDESTGDKILSYALLQELQGIRDYSLAQVALVGEERLSSLLSRQPAFRRPEKGWVDFQRKVTVDGHEEIEGFGTEFFGTLSQKKTYPILWVGQEKESLAENEVILDVETVMNYTGYRPGEGEAIDPETGKIRFSLLTREEKEQFIESLSWFESFEIHHFRYNAYEESRGEVKNLKVVGILFPDDTGALSHPGNVTLISDVIGERVLRLDDGIYEYAVGKMPEKESDVRRLVEFSYAQDDTRFELQNSVTFELDAIHEVLVVLADVFLYVGLGFALFAALMLANFIGTSIAYKREQIGILRAIGARSGDVFRIFFSESFVIAMINFILSALGTFLVVTLINYLIRSETGILITLLTFSLRQVVLLFGASLLVAALASFIPVKRIASKKPIDAIRGR